MKNGLLYNDVEEQLHVELHQLHVLLLLLPNDVEGHQETLNQLRTSSLGGPL